VGHSLIECIVDGETLSPDELIESEAFSQAGGKIRFDVLALGHWFENNRGINTGYILQLKVSQKSPESDRLMCATRRWEKI